MRFSIDFYDRKSLNNTLNLLESRKISFLEVVEYAKTKKHNNRNFIALLTDEQFFEDLLKRNLLSKADLKYLVASIENYIELEAFDLNHGLFRHLLLRKALSFKDVVDKYVSIIDNNLNSGLLLLIGNAQFNAGFEYFVENSILNKEDLKYLLDKIEEPNIIANLLMRNSKFLDWCFKNFLVDKHIIEKFDELVKESQITFLSSLLKPYDELSLTTIKNYVLASSVSYDDDKKKLIFNIIQNSEIAKDRLAKIIDSNLENNYSFNELMQYLKKAEKKNILNI